MFFKKIKSSEINVNSIFDLNPYSKVLPFQPVTNINITEIGYLFWFVFQNSFFEIEGVFYTYQTSPLGLALFQLLKDTCGPVASILDREQVTFTYGASSGGTRMGWGTGGMHMVGSLGWGAG